MSSSPAVTREAQLDWEARTGRPAAVAAILSAALIFASLLVQSARIGVPDDEAETLRLFDEHHGDFFLSLGLQAASYFLLAGALFYLFRATSYRRSEAPKFAVGLLLLAPVLLGVGALLNQLELNRVADQFLSTDARKTEDLAKMMLDDRDQLGGSIAQGGTLCLALSFVLVSLNAMRAGLLSRFMGVLGIIAGTLLVIPLLPGTVIQIFWLAALGALFLGRWPGGRGPAWETGEAVPWPPAAEVRARQSGHADDEPDHDEPDHDEPESADEPEGEVETPPHPVSRKRKKKRR